MIDLTGKTALITGAASEAGIGFACAKVLAAQGAKLFITDLNHDAITARADELKAEGYEVHAAVQDVTVEADWDATIKAMVSAYGQVDIVVNNAGIAVLKMMSDMTLPDWNHQINVNMTSVYLGCKAAMDQMRVQGHGGSIINLSSVAGLVGVQGTSAYSASKGGVRLMSKSIALEGAAENIRCNSVHPGMIFTDMQKVAMADNREQFDLITAAIPMGRMGEAVDIANTIAFLASDAAKYITGAEFVVDGGMIAQ